MTSAPSPRVSALAFTEGSGAGWLASDLTAWMSNHLLSQGRFDAEGGTIRLVREHGVGAVSLSGHPPARKDRIRTASQVPTLIAAARDRIIQSLRLTVRSGETSFVNAALYAGRVSRERGADGMSQWFVYLSEDDALSDQVLALFAADALTHPTDYEQSICVCEACGAVSFNPSASSRHGCAIHPHGSLDGKPVEAQPQPRLARS